MQIYSLSLVTAQAVEGTHILLCKFARLLNRSTAFAKGSQNPQEGDLKCGQVSQTS